MLMEDIRRDLIEREDQGETSTKLVEYRLSYVEKREASEQIEPSAASNYRSSIKHIARYMGDLSIGEVIPERILEMQAGLLEDGLVADTVAKEHRFLKQVMDYAAEMGHISHTPFNKAIKPPKRRRPRPNALDERSREALMSALDSSPTTRQSLAARLGLLAGLRREEVAGLGRGDVDLSAGRLYVRRAIGVLDGKPYLKGTKTEAEEREVVLESSLANALGELRRSRGAMRSDSYVLGMGSLSTRPTASPRTLHPSPRR